MTQTADRTYTPREVSDQLKLSVTTIYRLIKSHELPAVRLGGQFRVPAAELEKRLHPDK